MTKFTKKFNHAFAKMTELKWYRLHASRITNYTATVEASNEEKAKDMKDDNLDWTEFDSDDYFVHTVEEA